MPLSKGKRHQPGDGFHINFERVDAQIRQVALMGKPGGEGFNIEGFAGATGVTELLAGQKYQRVCALLEGCAATDQGQFGTFVMNATLSEQQRENVGEVQPLIMRWGGVHKRSCKHVPGQVLVRAELQSLDAA